MLRQHFNGGVFTDARVQILVQASKEIVEGFARP